MNLQYKVFIITLLLNLSASANEVILITHFEQQQMAKEVSKLIQKNQGIPRSFIEIREKKEPCQRRKESIVHLCLKNGEMKLLNFNHSVGLGILKEFSGRAKIE